MPEYQVLVYTSIRNLRKALDEHVAAGWTLMGPVQTLSVDEGYFVATLERPTGPAPTVSQR